MHDWKFSRIMKQSGMFFTEMHLLKIVERLGVLGNWSQALSVVEWVYNEKQYKHRKSRYDVYMFFFLHFLNWELLICLE